MASAPAAPPGRRSWGRRPRSPTVERVLERSHVLVDLVELDRLLLEQVRRTPTEPVQLVDERAEVEQQRVALAPLAAQVAPRAYVSHRAPLPPPEGCRHGA